MKKYAEVLLDRDELTLIWTALEAYRAQTVRALGTLDGSGPMVEGAREVIKQSRDAAHCLADRLARTEAAL